MYFFGDSFKHLVFLSQSCLNLFRQTELNGIDRMQHSVAPPLSTLKSAIVETFSILEFQT